MRVKQRPQATAAKEKACPACGKMRAIDAMPKHYRVKHPAKTLPIEFYVGEKGFDGHPIGTYAGKFPPGTRVKVRGFRKHGRMFDFYVEYDAENVIGLKGTVYDVTPEDWGGKGTPAIIHVHMDTPIVTKYYHKMSSSFLERELRVLKKKA